MNNSTTHAWHRFTTTHAWHRFTGTGSVTEAAKQLGVTRVTFSRIINGKSGISPDMALRLAAWLGTTPDSWLNMQTAYDLWQAEQSDHLCCSYPTRMKVSG